MKRFFGILAGVVLASNVFAADLKVGQLAPDFSLPGSDGKTYTLSDYRGVRAVVLSNVNHWQLMAIKSAHLM